MFYVLLMFLLAPRSSSDFVLRPSRQRLQIFLIEAKRHNDRNVSFYCCESSCAVVFNGGVSADEKLVLQPIYTSRITHHVQGENNENDCLPGR